MSPWAWFVIGGGVLTAVELALPDGPARDLLYGAVAVASVVAILVGIRLHRPRRRAPWALIAAGVATWVLGDVTWWYLAEIAGVAPFPSAADVLYLTSYALLITGLLLMTAEQRRVVGRSSIIDPLVVAVAGGLVLWVVLVEPTWTEPGADLLVRVLGTAYPAGDLALLAMLLHLGATVTGRTPTFRLLVAGLAAILVADLAFQGSAYLPLVAQGDRWIDVGWLAGYVLWGAAALHPSMAVRERPRSVTDASTVSRFVLIGFAVLLLPGLIVTETLLGAQTHTTAVSIASVLIVVLVLVRIIDLVRHLHDQARRLEVLAATDVTTGLENRRRLVERVGDLLAGASPTPAALLLVTVGRLSEINETLGERTGDELLCAVGQRLTLATESDGVVARTGVETFGVLLPGVSDGAVAERRAREVRTVFADPFALTEVTLALEGAIGIAVAPSDAATANELLYRADVALSAARERPGRVARYAEQMEADGAPAPQLMAELGRAIEEGEIVLHYQPQVDLTSGRVLGVEALVRWQHPEHGLLPPVTFIPAAERTGLIRLLTLHVLDQAVGQTARWRASGLDLSVAVNLSVRDLLDPTFVDGVRGALARHDLPAEALELELTETMAMVDPTRSLEVLNALDALGVTVSVDDYGTGHSSLAYLQRLPLRRLKIDRSFVANVVDGKASAAIVRSTIELARHLGLDVVAEGVEDDVTLLALREMRCYSAQGFGIGRPVPPAAIPHVVAGIEKRLPAVLAPVVPAQRVVG